MGSSCGHTAWKITLYFTKTNWHYNKKLDYFTKQSARRRRWRKVPRDIKMRKHIWELSWHHHSSAPFYRSKLTPFCSSSDKNAYIFHIVRVLFLYYYLNVWTKSNLSNTAHESTYTSQCIDKELAICHFPLNLLRLSISYNFCFSFPLDSNRYFAFFCQNHKYYIPLLVINFLLSFQLKIHLLNTIKLHYLAFIVYSIYFYYHWAITLWFIQPECAL